MSHQSSPVPVNLSLPLNKPFRLVVNVDPVHAYSLFQFGKTKHKVQGRQERLDLSIHIEPVEEDDE